MGARKGFMLSGGFGIALAHAFDHVLAKLGGDPFTGALHPRHFAQPRHYRTVGGTRDGGRSKYGIVDVTALRMMNGVGRPPYYWRTEKGKARLAKLLKDGRGVASKRDGGHQHSSSDRAGHYSAERGEAESVPQAAE